MEDSLFPYGLEREGGQYFSIYKKRGDMEHAVKRCEEKRIMGM